MPRVILILLATATTSVAQAQWDVPLTRHRVNTSELDPLSNERGYLRVPRLVIGAQMLIPLRDHGDDAISAGVVGSMGVDVALGVAFSIGLYARAGWWREGTDDILDDPRDHALLDVGTKLRVRASAGIVSVFLGGHGGISYDWSFENDARDEGWHIGPHVGFHIGKIVATEVEAGINLREIGGESWLDAYGTVAMTIALRSVR